MEKLGNTKLTSGRVAVRDDEQCCMSRATRKVLSLHQHSFQSYEDDPAGESKQ